MTSLRQTQKMIDKLPNTRKNIKFSSRYGRADAGLPNYSLDYAAIEDNLQKGQLTQAQANKEKEGYRQASLLYIAATNAMGLRGYMPKLAGKPKRKRK